jgi:hypothetical protein
VAFVSSVTKSVTKITIYDSIGQQLLLQQNLGIPPKLEQISSNHQKGLVYFLSVFMTHE